MQNDSDIISYATWSLNNESPLALRQKYHRPSSNGNNNNNKNNTDEEADAQKKKKKEEDIQEEKQKEQQQQQPKSHSQPPGTIKHEVQTFCCCLSFLTIKSFRFHSIKVYLCLIILLGLFQQMIQGGYLAAIMSTLQTQFNMSTSKIGFITSCFDIMGVFATPILSYMGSKYNKCKLLGMSNLFYALGAVVYTLPYFLSPKYTVPIVNNSTMMSTTNTFASISSMNDANSVFDATVDMCKYPVGGDNTTTTLTTTTTTTTSILLEAGSTSTTTPEPVCNRNAVSAASTWTYSMFIVAQLLMSIGSAPLFSLGLTYLTDNLEERRHALYTGLLYGSLALGPALGYVLASILLSKWIYPNETPPVNEKDPRWVGCWYPGLLAGAGVVFIVALLLMTFPAHISASRRSEMRTKRELKRAERQAAKKQWMMNKRASANLGSTSSSDKTGGGEQSPQLAKEQFKLETIDEETTADQITAEIDRTFEFLDSEHSGIGSTMSTSNDDTLSSSPSIFTIEKSTLEQQQTKSQNESVGAKEPSPMSAWSSDKEKPHEHQQQKHQQKWSFGDPREQIRHHHRNLLVKSQDLQARLLYRLQNSQLKFKGLLGSLISLVLNLRYTLLVLILSAECILVAAFTNYMVLYVQNVYQVPSSRASILAGGVVVPSAILGAILGGILVKKFKMGITGCVRLMMINSVLVLALLFILLVFLHCTGPISKGIDLATQTFNGTFDLCNADCGCLPIYNPTCGIDDISYVSPCYAGCKLSDAQGYYDCSCISINATDDSPIPNDNNLVMATPNMCTRNCDAKLVITLILLFLTVAIESLSLTPATMVILNLIEKPLQPFALGVLRCSNILLAYIPAPIVLSNLIDRTCVLWNRECIGDKGTCLEYSAIQFHIWLFGSGVVVKVVACILLVVLSVYTHKSFILRHKYRSNVTLYHDDDQRRRLSSRRNERRHRYMIESEVASESDNTNNNTNTESSSLDSFSFLVRFRRPSSITTEKTPPQSSSAAQEGTTPVAAASRGAANHRESAAPSVVLKRHVIFDDEYNSVVHVPTPTVEMSLIEPIKEEHTETNTPKDTTAGV